MLQIALLCISDPDGEFVDNCDDDGDDGDDDDDDDVNDDDDDDEMVLLNERK